MRARRRISGVRSETRASDAYETLKVACDAEAAIADGKYKDAEKLIENKIAAQKSAGHATFKDSVGR